MSNELIMLGTAIFDLLIVLAAFYLGRPYLIGVIVLNLLLVSLTAQKVGDAFGLIASPQSIFYAAIFLGTDLLAEFHGKRSAYHAVGAGFIGLFLLVLLGQAVIWFEPTSTAQNYGQAVDTVFGATFRIAIASFTAYLIAQSFDVWFFHWIKNVTSGNKLWLRNLGSTSTSQLLDTVIFFPIAFLGVVPNLLQLMVVAYALKIAVALLDTPYIYLAHFINRKWPGEQTATTQELAGDA